MWIPKHQVRRRLCVERSAASGQQENQSPSEVIACCVTAKNPAQLPHNKPKAYVTRI